MATDLNRKDMQSAPRVIPDGIRRSQEALRKALPQMLEQPGYFHKWAAFHGDELLGVARDPAKLLQECIRRRLQDDQYYIGWIDYSEMIDDEEVEIRQGGWV
jgi:hypothetical protein